MSSSDNGSDIIVHDASPLLRVYKSGRVERFVEFNPVPPSLDQTTGVESKDNNIFPQVPVTARLYRPNLDENPKTKLPILVYFHGGGFCVESTFNPIYHDYLNSLASRARVLIVSVEYRLAPEHVLPSAYDDCWRALNWFISHSKATSPDSSNREAWLLENGDFARVYLAGDSAGANIAHHLGLQVGNNGICLSDASIRNLNGIILFNPFFWGKDLIGDEAAKLITYPYPDLTDQLWQISCPMSSGLDDPWINPIKDTTLSGLGCERVLIFVAEKDIYRDRGVAYKESLVKSGWKGKVEVVESKGEGHVFHLMDPSCANALAMMTMVVDFLNPPPTPATTGN